jgi:protein-S-isoprenylcysteine O-methyltransferase Ste14
VRLGWSLLVELINPFAVVRNTATHEAYKAYVRKAAWAGQPFFFAGIVLGVLTPQVFFMLTRSLLHKPLLDWRWALTGVGLSMALGIGLMGIGAWRTIRFRKDNPMPDEWRQVPRSNPLVTHKARLLSRD